MQTQKRRRRCLDYLTSFQNVQGISQWHHSFYGAKGFDISLPPQYCLLGEQFIIQNTECKQTRFFLNNLTVHLSHIDPKPSSIPLAIIFSFFDYQKYKIQAYKIRKVLVIETAKPTPSSTPTACYPYFYLQDGPHTFQTWQILQAMNFQHPACSWLQATKRTFLVPPDERNQPQAKEALLFHLAPINFPSFFSLQQNQTTMTNTGPKVVDLLVLAALLAGYPEDNATLRMIRRFNRRNVLNIEELIPAQIMEMAGKLESRLCGLPAREEEGGEAGETGGWVPGERKLFACILPFFCERYRLDIQNLEISDVLPLTRILPTKDQITLLFEIKHICSLNNSLKTPWNPQGLLRLASIVSQPKYLQITEGNMKWKQVSFQLFCQNGLSTFHSPRECRERWINHLDPTVSKTSWSASQDLEMFLLLRKLGCRWALVSRSMKGTRTENMIKNRTFALVKKYCPKKTAKLKETQIEAVITALQARLAEENESKVEDMDGLKDDCQKENAELESQHSAYVPLDLFDVFTRESRYVFSLEDEEENWQYNQPRQLELPELFSFPTPQTPHKDSCTIFLPF